MKVWVGILIGLCAPLAIGAVVIAAGFVDVSATSSPGAIERTIAPYARDRSIARRAPKTALPQPDDNAIARGREHYRTNCLVCHAAPGLPSSELAKGLNPLPPSLESKATQSRTDGELYWIISRGIRMTGMPAFSPTHADPEIWNLVAFVRRLPRMTDDDRSFLRQAPADEGSHHRTVPNEHGTETAKSAPAADNPDPADHGHSADHQHHNKHENRK